MKQRMNIRPWIDIDGRSTIVRQRERYSFNSNLQLLKKRWWCDWYVSPSEGEYFRKDEIDFFRLIILIPFVFMLLSWPWFDHFIL